MRISVIGCGYLGAVHAASMASLGHEVVGIDLDQGKIDLLSAGLAPFFEPGLPDLLRTGVESGRLTFSTDISNARGAQVHFIAVGTPQAAGSHAADLRFVDSAVTALRPYLSEGDVVAGKSTVPVGTAARLSESLSGTGAIVVWNPEFLREGFAVKDTIHPDRIVYGLPDDDVEARRAQTLLDEVYRSALDEGTPLVATNLATAELVKVAANAFLATKISFINAMAEISETVGADVTELADALGHDSRIGRRFLNAGAGFGGGCLPKDIRAFVARAEELGRGEALNFLKEVDAINLRRRDRVVQLTVDALDGSVYRKKIAVLGLAFKPDSDDIRDSPALDIAVRLHGLGAQVVAADPQAIVNSQKAHPQLNFGTTDEALHEADAVVLVTEWDEYRQLEPTLASSLARGRAIVDARNCLPTQAWRDAGWHYVGLGRGRS